MTTPQTPPPPTPHDSERTTHDVSFLLHCVFGPLVSDRSQMTNLPSVPTPRHRQHSHRSTAHDTATSTADHRHPYTRAPSHHLASAYPHIQPHVTQRWPDPDLVASTSFSHVPQRFTSPEVTSPSSQHNPRQTEHGEVDRSTLLDDEQVSSPMSPSSHMATNPAEFAPQPGSFEQRSPETHSGKKRHKCDICGSYWGRPSSLKIHMVSHTGVKGRTCTVFPIAANLTSTV